MSERGLERAVGADLARRMSEQIERGQVPPELGGAAPPAAISGRGRSSAGGAKRGHGCELCDYTGYVFVAPYCDLGTRRECSSGVRRCECVERRIVERALAAVPKELGMPRLEDLRPRYDLHPHGPFARRVGDVQAAAIAEMRARPEASYLLCGENGTGKTHLAYALYLEALFAGRRVVACTVQELLDEFKRMELRETGRDGGAFRARVVPEDLRQKHTRWTVLLDEFEKARVTEFTCETLFALLDAAWKFGHQLLVTSNKDFAGLEERWGRVDEVYGRSIVKRLTAAATGVEIFFDGEGE